MSRNNILDKRQRKGNKTPIEFSPKVSMLPTMEPRPILFNDSNQYFPNASILQSSIGFISPLDIDIYVKTSFGILTNQIMIT